MISLYQLSRIYHNFWFSEDELVVLCVCVVWESHRSFADCRFFRRRFLPQSFRFMTRRRNTNILLLNDSTLNRVITNAFSVLPYDSFPTVCYELLPQVHNCRTSLNGNTVRCRCVGAICDIVCLASSVGSSTSSRMCLFIRT